MQDIELEATPILEWSGVGTSNCGNKILQVQDHGCNLAPH